MALSTVVKAKGNGLLTLLDNGGSNTLAVTFDNGDFSASGFTQGLRQTAPAESRGKFKSLYFTDRQYIEGSFSCMLTQFTEPSGTGTVADFLLQRAAYSANVSVLGAGADMPYAVDIKLTIEGTNLGDGADLEFVLTKCRITSLDVSEGDPDTLSLSFTSYGAPTGDLALSEA
jgi:hypothetical protein|tara:strand:+ start:264 stop:782 length:519 start_codon:yes stop_codon:yes gene_type:complete